MGRRTESDVFKAASVFAVLSAVLMFVCGNFIQNSLYYLAAFTGVSACLSVTASLACVDIWRLSPADSHTLRTLVVQYVAILALRIRGGSVMKQLQKDLENPEKAQNDTLMAIIRQNASTAYGKDHSFEKIRNRDDFRRMHPLTTYAHHQPYVDRLAAGEHNVITGDQVLFLANSSATTGKIKRYPITKKYTNSMADGIIFAFNWGLMKLFCLKRMHVFHLYAPIKYTEGGNLPYGSGSNYIIKIPIFDVVPGAFCRVYEEKASYYCQALFCLRERELQNIRGFSATLMYSFFKFIEDNMDDLCEDISSGTLRAEVNLDPEVRRELASYLSPDPARAAELRQCFSRGIVGLAKRMWPDLELIVMAKSAGFALCLKILEESYLKGLKITGFGHGASEGLLGLVLEKEPWIGEVNTMIPSTCFWEFIPLQEVDSENPSTLMMHQLEKGHLYEVVVSNINGLYRCRFGDVIKVIGYNKNTPKYEFQYRLGQRLNIGFERTPEKTLYDALDIVSKRWPSDKSVIDYTTTESLVIEQVTGNRGLGHYVYFLEMGGADPDLAIPTTEYAAQIDETLCDLREAYRIHRGQEKGSIGPLRVIQVKGGTFDELKRHLWGAAQNGQFKMPRVLRKIPAIEFLLKNEVK